MVEFDGFLDTVGVYYVNRFSENKKVRIDIIDQFTGLLFYTETMELCPEIRYFTVHAYPINNQIFSAYDADTNEQYFSVTLNRSSDKIKLSDFYKDFILKVPEKFKRNFVLCLNIFEISINKAYDRWECYVKEGDIVFDIGGFCGFFSKHAIDKGASKVYRFEPNPEAVNLSKHFFRGHNIVVEAVAVGKDNGFATIDCSNGIDLLGQHYYGNEIFVETINIMDYIIKNSIDRIDYLKIDTEGAEYDILESIHDEFLRDNVQRIAIEYHNNHNFEVDQLTDKLDRCGFDYKFAFENGRDLDLSMLYAWKKINN